MKNIKVLKVKFDTLLHPSKIPQFRGAVVQKVGREDTLLFHHHLNDTQYLYHYPLIQYACIYQHPSIVCLEEGTTEIHKLFAQPSWDVTIGEEEVALKIDTLNMHQFTLQLTDQQREYRLFNWLALGQEKYQEYQQLTGLVAQIQFLEKILVGNILSFASGIGWYIEHPIELAILQLKEPRGMNFKSTRLLAFDVTFACNVFIPNDIGLGRKVSMGFGRVREVRKSGEGN